MFPLQEVDFDSSSTMVSSSNSEMKHRKRATMSSETSGYTTATSTVMTNSISDHDDEWTLDLNTGTVLGGFYASIVQQLFPYHIVVNRYFQVIAAGDQLFRMMNCQAKERILGQAVDTIFSIRKPTDAEWSWEWLTSRGSTEDFRISPAMGNGLRSNMMLRFKANIVQASQEQVMINMVPDANTVKDLLDMDLTMQDMPSHGGYRQALELQSRLDGISRTDGSRRKATANLCESLTKEKELLESLVPKHVAQGLRLGENVAPRQHDQVTFFFSDVVGFTDMCKQLYPWQVCGMLNRLYCVMDYLLDKFGLFKVETIGDAYVCCSGIPEPDQDHAEKVANFAIAVSHCVKHVLSPVDGKPIQLRIGVHTGSAASGVVGVNNPRYCVFGDTVNVTARHECTGEAGRVHCSAVTQRILNKEYPGEFKLKGRGMVEMKGKGSLKTYWLESSSVNRFVNKAGMSQLEMETDELLEQTKFESDLEKKTQEQTLQLAATLGQGKMSEKQQQVMGPVLDIIRQELAGKNQLNMSTHSGSGDSSSAHSKGAPSNRRGSLARSKSWDAPDQEQAKKLEKHFGKSDRGYKYTPSGQSKPRPPVRTPSLDGSMHSMVEAAAASVAHDAPHQPEDQSLVGMVSHGMVEASKAKSKVTKATKSKPGANKRRGGRRTSGKQDSIVPALPPAQLFDILERALDEFDDDDSF